MKRALFLSLLLCFTVSVQAMVSAEHVHIDHAAEVDCQICAGINDLAPEISIETNPIHGVSPHGFAPAILATRTLIIGQRARAPPHSRLN